jgi:hypothetical protein
MVGSLLQ